MSNRTNNANAAPTSVPAQQKLDVVLRKLYGESDTLLKKSSQLHVEEQKVVAEIAEVIIDIDVMIKTQVEEEEEIKRLRLKIEENVKITDLPAADLAAREQRADIIEGYVMEGNPGIQKSMEHLKQCRKREQELEVKLKSVSKLLTTNTSNMKSVRDETAKLAMEMITQVKTAVAQSNEHLNLHTDFSAKMKKALDSINAIVSAKQSEVGNYAALQSVAQEMNAEIKASEELANRVSVGKTTQWPLKTTVVVQAVNKR
jgi:enamine deaminase RidA (YjgF/YER057c/UK114 family)